MEEVSRGATPRDCAECYGIRHSRPPAPQEKENSDSKPGQMELAQPFLANPSRRRKTPK